MATEPARAPSRPLPEPALRWLRHAVAVDALPAERVRLSMRGSIRLGRWREFTATEVLDARHGFVWSARVGRGPTRVTGADRFWDGAGSMRWRLLGLIPVMRASGPDVTRSAAGRFAGEMVFCPPCLVSACGGWSAGPGADEFVAEVQAGGARHALTLALDPGGRLRSLTMPRWGDPEGTGYALREFAVRLDGEIVASGYAVPAHMRAAWPREGVPWDEAEFFRATITGITFG